MSMSRIALNATSGVLSCKDARRSGVAGRHEDDQKGGGDTGRRRRCMWQLGSQEWLVKRMAEAQSMCSDWVLGREG